jgi:hypothetical protein
MTECPKTLATIRQQMDERVQKALRLQGTCSREDWLTQLDRFHGRTNGYAPRKQSFSAASTKVS